MAAKKQLTSGIIHTPWPANIPTRASTTAASTPRRSTRTHAPPTKMTTAMTSAASTNPARNGHGGGKRTDRGRAHGMIGTRHDNPASRYCIINTGVLARGQNPCEGCRDENRGTEQDERMR